MSYLKELLKNYKQTGTILGSSNVLTKALLDLKSNADKRFVIEIGPGKGEFTQKLIETYDNYLGIEINHRFYDELWSKYGKEYFILGSASNLVNIVKDKDIGLVSCVINCIPISLASDELNYKIVKSSYEVLQQGGIFKGYNYFQTQVVPKTTRFKKNLKKVFDCEVDQSFVGLNIPPAIIYKVQKSF